jgi:hypothetical protein
MFGALHNQLPVAVQSAVAPGLGPAWCTLLDGALSINRVVPCQSTGWCPVNQQGGGWVSRLAAALPAPRPSALLVVLFGGLLSICWQ